MEFNGLHASLMFAFLLIVSSVAFIEYRGRQAAKQKKLLANMNFFEGLALKKGFILDRKPEHPKDETWLLSVKKSSGGPPYYKTLSVSGPEVWKILKKLTKDQWTHQEVISYYFELADTPPVDWENNRK